METATTETLKGRFFAYLLAANRPRLDGFRHWLLHPGMLFQARWQWWGAQKPRPTPHEGLDLYWFLDEAGNRQILDQQIVLPAPFPGIIGKIGEDFLGQSIFLDHELPAPQGSRLVSAFGHTSPRSGLKVGQRILAGDLIGAIAETRRRKTSVPAHLHLTLAYVPEAIPTAGLSWQILGTEAAIVLLDPLLVFPTAFVVEATQPA